MRDEDSAGYSKCPVQVFAFRGGYGNWQAQCLSSQKMEANRIQIVVRSSQHPGYEETFACWLVKAGSCLPSMLETVRGVRAAVHGGPREGPGTALQSQRTLLPGVVGDKQGVVVSSSTGNKLQSPTLGKLSRADSPQALSLQVPMDGLGRVSRASLAIPPGDLQLCGSSMRSTFYLLIAHSHPRLTHSDQLLSAAPGAAPLNVAEQQKLRLQRVSFCLCCMQPHCVP